MAAHSLFLSKLKPAQQRQKLQQRLFARQGSVCFLCEEPIDADLQRDMLEVDHIVPVASGGKDEENNLALTRESCNRRKSASDLRVARVMMRFARIEAEAGRTGREPWPHSSDCWRRHEEAPHAPRGRHHLLLYSDR